MVRRPTGSEDICINEFYRRETPNGVKINLCSFVNVYKGDGDAVGYGINI
jgi:hypothetical protein